jgi:hypothetical protein
MADHDVRTPAEDDRKGTERSMDTEDEVVARLHDEGYVHHFVIDDDRVRCPECDETVAAKAVHIDQTHRFEGPTNPGDESVAFAISNGPCGHRGVLVTGYGPNAPEEEAEGIRLLGTEPAEPEDDPITAREAAEQVLIDEGESEAGGELGDEMP